MAGPQNQNAKCAEGCSFAGLGDPGTNWRLTHQAVDSGGGGARVRHHPQRLLWAHPGRRRCAEDPSVSPTGGSRRSSPSITDPYYRTIRWRSDLVTYFLSKMDSLKDEVGQSLLDSASPLGAHQSTATTACSGTRSSRQAATESSIWAGTSDAGGAP